MIQYLSFWTTTFKTFAFHILYNFSAQIQYNDTMLVLLNYNLSFAFAFNAQQLHSLPDLRTSEWLALQFFAFVQLDSSNFHVGYLLSFLFHITFFSLWLCPTFRILFPIWLFWLCTTFLILFPIWLLWFCIFFWPSFFFLSFVHSFSFNSAVIQIPDIAFHVFHRLPWSNSPVVAYFKVCWKPSKLATL